MRDGLKNEELSNVFYCQNFRENDRYEITPLAVPETAPDATGYRQKAIHAASRYRKLVLCTGTNVELLPCRSQERDVNLIVSVSALDREEFRPEATSARPPRARTVVSALTDIVRSWAEIIVIAVRFSLGRVTTLQNQEASLKRQCNEERCENKKVAKGIGHEICSECSR